MDTIPVETLVPTLLVAGPLNIPATLSLLMTPLQSEVMSAVTLAQQEILADPALVGQHISSFCDLHDFEDANMYGHTMYAKFLLHSGLGPWSWMPFFNAVQNSVDSWIKAQPGGTLKLETQ